MPHQGFAGRDPTQAPPLHLPERDEILKNMKLTSPRGPIAIDPATRDIVQTVYIRKVEKRGNEYWNVEFDKFENVKDPGK